MDIQYIVLLSIALTIVIYYGIPNLLVKLWPDRFPEVRPFMFMVVMLGGKIKRFLCGESFHPIVKDSSIDFSRAHFKVVEFGETDDPHDYRGGKLDLLVAFIDAWVHKVTGHRVAAADFQDLLSATLADYNANRPEEMRGSVGAGPRADRSHYAHLAQQKLPLNIIDAETGGKATTMGPDGVEIIYDSRISASFPGCYAIIQVTDPYFPFNAFRENYYGVVIKRIEASIANIVRTLTIDGLFSKEVKEEVMKRPLLENAELKENYGFKIVEIIIDKVVPDPEYLKWLNLQQQTVKEMESAITKAKMGRQVAEQKQLAALEDAKGEAHFVDQRLAKQNKHLIEMAKTVGPLAANIVQTDSLSNASSNVTVFSNSGSGAMQPVTPVINVGDKSQPSTQPESPPAEEGKK